MKFLTGILSGTPELKELSAAVETGKLPAAVTGLSAVHKAAYIRTLSQMTGRRTLVLTGDEREAQRLSDDLSSMGCARWSIPCGISTSGTPPAPAMNMNYSACRCFPGCCWNRTTRSAVTVSSPVLTRRCNMSCRPSC